MNITELVKTLIEQTNSDELIWNVVSKRDFHLLEDFVAESKFVQVFRTKYKENTNNLNVYMAKNTLKHYDIQNDTFYTTFGFNLFFLDEQNNLLFDLTDHIGSKQTEKIFNGIEKQQISNKLNIEFPKEKGFDFDPNL